MTNQYRAVSIYGKAIFGEDIFDADFAASEEKDHLDGGHLELVPRKYTITSNNFTGGAEGDEYEAALVKDIEEMLVAGGHLARVDVAQDKKETAAEKKAAAKKAADEKAALENQ